MPTNPPPPKTTTSSTAAKSRPAPVPAPPPRKPAVAAKPAPVRKPATPRRASRGPHLSVNIPAPMQRELMALALIVVAILIGLSLVAAQDAGLLGSVGGALGAIFGGAAWVVPLLLVAAAVLLFLAGMRHIERLRWEMPLGLGLLLVAVVGLMHLGLAEADKALAADLHLGGGWLGYQIGSMLTLIAGTAGAGVILLALALVGLMLAFQVSLGQLAATLGRGGHALIALFSAVPKAQVVGPKISTPERATVLPPSLPAPVTPKGRPGARPALLLDDDDGIPADVPVNGLRRPGAEPTPDVALRILGRSPDEIAADKGKPPVAAPPIAQPPTPSPPPPAADPLALITGRSGAELAKQLSLPLAGPSLMMWKMPDLALLERATDVEVNDRDLRDKARKIEESLATFGVQARVREINSGPTVTQFALEPGEGVRVARIAALGNDLALALAAPSIRIEAPIPGHSRIGIEVPNTTPGMVGLRNILETEVFRAGKGKLKLPIGRDTHGQPVFTDMTKLPHLLIAGATGSGKSVAINALIISLIMQLTPDEVRFLMIDPKRVELAGFNGIPHLLRPVVTEMKPEREGTGKKGPREITAIEVLKWLLWEMERRYRLFAKGVKDADGVTKVYRNIEQYHLAARATPTLMEPLPYIVLIIDELADLMLVAPEDVETALCRLAQLARATGIHLVIATQRPSVDVVTGLIKANFPARLAFAVTSMIDSRVILDTPGAEKLLGRGDALYTASDEAKPIRVQGTFVSDKEAEKVVAFWRAQLIAVPPPAPVPGQPAHAPGSPPPAPIVPGSPPEPDWLAALETTGGDDKDDDDTLLHEAIALVQRHKYASTSMLQRRLRIGYNRAARLIEQLEAQGIVGPADGARPRQVLVNADITADVGGKAD